MTSTLFDRAAAAAILATNVDLPSPVTAEAK